MCKTGKARTPKDDLTKILEPETVSQVTNLFYWNTNDHVENYFMVAWKGKTNRAKGKKRKKNFITTMIFINFCTTLPGEPASKKRHNSDGIMSPPIFFHTKICKLY